jgi:exodeoxyribonuclease V alpha subunit
MHGQGNMGWAPGGAREDRRTGTVQRFIHNPDTDGPAFRVLEVCVDDALEVWTGEVAPIGNGASIIGYGHDYVNPRYGRREFKCRAIVVSVPTDKAALEKFMVQAKLPGIGKKKAREVVNHFGADMIDVLAKAPHRLGEIKGLGGKNLTHLVETVQNRALDLLLSAEMASYGAHGAVAKRILARYGARSLEVVRTDPYGLSFEVTGVGFRTADTIAAAQGISGEHPRRVQAAIMAILDKASDDGHVYLPTSEAIWRSADLLGGSESGYQFHVAISALADQKHVARQMNGKMLGIRRLVLAEQKVAERLTRLIGEVRIDSDLIARTIDESERRARISLAPEQREAVELIARSRIAVMTGGPGTGKSSTQRVVLDILRKSGLRIAFAAPTGRAAKRLRETTGENAQTIHRLLGWNEENQRFEHDEQNPLPFDVVIVDEASMLELPLANSLLAAINPKSRVVFVGDVDQLPPVGPGAVLRDIIESGAIPTVRLRRVFRQAHGSQIVTVAAAINAGEELNAHDDEDAEVRWIRCRNNQDLQDRVIDIVTRDLPSRFGASPIHDIQVLVPIHEDLGGTKALNIALQSRLNPPQGAEEPGTVFRAGDKVMNTVNDYDHDIYNGDIGIVVSVRPDRDTALVVRFDERRVQLNKKQAAGITLAYASTVHKAQGGECKIAVVALPDGRARIMLTRRLFYTAVTRGKERVVIVASENAIRATIAETRRSHRHTLLADRLRACAARAASDPPPPSDEAGNNERTISEEGSDS